MASRDEENPVTEDEAEKEKLRPHPPQEMEMTKIPLKTKSYHPEVIAGQQEPFFKSHHLKYMIFGFNFFIAILGLALLCITIWIRADPEFWEYETTLDVDNFNTVLALLIFASLVILLVGVLGSLGAASERRWMLMLYMGLFGLIILLQLGALILMWSAPYSLTISQKLEEQIGNQVTSSEHDDSSRHFIDFIQAHLKCCGSTGIRDYKQRNWDAPNSCRDPRTGSDYVEGCSKKMLSYMRSKSWIVGGVALPIVLVQVLALAATVALLRSLDVESKYFM